MGVIVTHNHKFLLELNTTAGYNNIISFLNTTLSRNNEEVFAEGELQSRALELIYKRTGYKNLHYLKTLHGSIERSFHKFDKDYNEIGLYEDTILVFELLSEDKDIIDPEINREIIWVNEEELTDLLHSDGQNGSSHLIKSLYDSQNL